VPRSEENRATGKASAEEWSAVNSKFQYGVLSKCKDREIQRMERGENHPNWVHKDRINFNFSFIPFSLHKVIGTKYIDLHK